MDDVSSLRRQATSYDNQRTQAERDKRVIEQKITRLREAETGVGAEKTIVSQLRTGVRNGENPDDIWQGVKRNNYSDYLKVDFRSAYDSYYNQLDSLHDEIILKIAELENEKRDRIFLISWLADQANTLWAKIRTAFN